MNTAFLLDGFDVGGTELNATRTLESLGQRGVTVDVIHFHRDGELRQRIANAGHRMHHLPIVPLRSPRVLGRVLALAQQIRKTGAQLVHAQDVYTNVLGAAACRLMGSPPIITSRRWKDVVPNRWFTPLNAWAHRNSALVLPNSESLTETLMGEGVRESRIEVHQNFIADAALQPLPSEERVQWRRSLGIADHATVIGCVARLTRVKRHDVLIDAFRLIAEIAPDAVLLIVGDGELRAHLQAQVHGAGMEDKVIFTGTLPNTPLPQQLFDIAVLTSENEGFPNALVEAAACAVPIVAPSVGGVVDVLLDGLTGLTVPVGDAQSTARVLLILLQDRHLRTSLGANGRRLVAASFSESAAIDRLLGIYEKVSRRPAT